MQQRIAVFVAGWILFALPVAAQEITGTIVGTVTDAQKKAVPKVTITLINTDMNVVIRTLETNDEGQYSAPLLPIGHYSVTAEVAGFRKATRTGIELNVNAHLTINFTLEVGSVTETVTVQAEQIQVDLQTPTATGLISGTEVRELSLNARVFEQLVALEPGVSYGGGDQLYLGTTSPFGTVNRADFAINGARTAMNNWTVDGADNVDRGSNLTLLSYPSVDAIAEFKVLRGLYNPEFGRAGGGQINVITRSGESKFHGSAYEFFRNDVLNANSFFNKKAEISAGKPNQPPALRYNNFGFTLSGPVYIPGVYNTKKDKTFFFFSQEYRRVITYVTQQAFLPTSAEKQGQMQFPVCVVFTASGACSTAPGSTSTTVTNIDPVAAAYIKDIWSKVPDPQDSLTHASQLTTFRNVFNNRQDMIRIDHVFGRRLSVFGRYLHDSIPTEEPFSLFSSGVPLPGVSNSQTRSPGTTWAARTTASLSTTLLLEAGYSYSYGAIISRLVGLMNPANSPDIKVPLPFTPTLQRIPTVSISSFTGVSAFGPYDDFNRDHNGFVNLSKIVRRHTFKWGVTYHHYQKTENAAGNNVGTFSFDFTGAQPVSPSSDPTNAARRAAQAWANFLMGRVASFSQTSQDLTPDIRANIIELFGQDEFRLRPNLTLSYGVRYSFFRQPIDARGEMTNFDPVLWNPAKAPLINPATGFIVVDASGKPTQGDPLNGIIIGGKNSPFGEKATNENYGNVGPRIGLSWDPWGRGKTAVRAGYGMSYDFIAYGNYELAIFANPPFVQNITIPSTVLSNPASGAPSISAVPRTLRANAVPFKTTAISQWSLDLQHELMRNLIVDVGYYGSKGTHLPGSVDINQPLPGDYLTKLGITTAITSGTATNRLNAIRPFLGYGPITMFATQFNSNYHSLQAAVQKRWKDGSLFKLNYTWSHNLADNDPSSPGGVTAGFISSNVGAGVSAPQNSYNIRAEYGPSGLDRRHMFSGSWVYYLPFFRNTGGFLGQAFGGWELSGIVSYNSGVPLTVRNNIPPGGTASVDPAGQGCLGASPCIVRPNQVSGPNAGAPHQLLQWFNTTAFVANTTLGRAGNAPRGSVIGPGYGLWDLSLFKNFRLTEQFRLQFRAETFNLLNHTNFNAVNMQFGGPVFGQVVSTRDPRVMQLALKLSF